MRVSFDDVTRVYETGQLEELLALQDIIGKRESQITTRPPSPSWDGSGLTGVVSSGDSPSASPRLEIIIEDDDGEID